MCVCWWVGVGRAGCDVIFNITEGGITNFFCFGGRYCLSFC